MNGDKIFYGTWGAVILMIGVCVILGMYLSLDVLEIFTLWILCVGAILFIAGIVSIKASKKSATIQMITGTLLVTISVGTLATFLKLLDVYVTLAIIVIVAGVTTVALGVSKTR